VLDACRHRATKRGLDLFGRRRGREIPILRGQAEQHVAHRSTDEHGRMSGRLQRARDLEDLVGHHGGAQECDGIRLGDCEGHRAGSMPRAISPGGA
jgi:hypothetical protein